MKRILWRITSDGYGSGNSHGSPISQYLQLSLLPSRRQSGGVAFIFPATSSNRSLMVLASKSQKDESNSSIEDLEHAAFTSQEDDLKYLLKLGGGSVFGAAAIKYGSVLFPEITRPNILQALFMISAPVILSVILLIKKSRVD